ncbi:MAG: hybrid sensor histidine kinase/response regulator, partial [Alphaproteobacteria bacterium]|nr:hybrid sensor histidine kinase/response regulator [Alphaproteobacteria bacterium]
MPDVLACSALILAPHGRDAAVAAALLQEIGIAAEICRSLAEFESHVNDTAAFAVVTEEAIGLADLQPLAALLRGQPPWSDLPFVIMTHHGGGPERNPHARRFSELLGNVTFLERPFHPATFISVARTALTSRQRQYEARARMQELHESGERLRHLNETLEQRVLARTAELEAAHAAVLAEIAEREQAEERLRHLEKMETLGQLTGGVAHDFNNLLMAVLANLELLAKHTRDDPKAAPLLKGAMEGAQRGVSLTQRLLAFARRQDLNVESRNLIEIVRSLRDLIERSIGSQIQLDIDLPETLPPVMVDANQIELALLNLVVNARDAMPQGGRLSIRLDCTQAEGDGDLVPGEYVRAIVADTGQGMDAETLRRATEPFFSTK